VRHEGAFRGFPLGTFPGLAEVQKNPGGDYEEETLCSGFHGSGG
jgi:hypothetical protein